MPENNAAALRRWLWGASALLVSLVALAYANAWRAPFVFDDQTNLVANRALVSGSVWSFMAHEPEDPGSTLAGRPVARFSFGVNRLIAGHSSASYRGGNLVIHLFAALLLAGALRRLVGRSVRRCDSERELIVLSWLAAGLWALHPLQTAAVTYVVQRVEALAALGIIACCYCFLRSLDALRPTRWQVSAVLAAALAAGTKETAVVAPVLVWLLDRTAGAGSFGRALRLRPWFYGALALTWLLLAALVIGSGGRGGTAGFDSGVSPWDYLLTQADGVMTYLRLIIWPEPQVFDYGMGLAHRLSDVWGPAIVVLAMLVGTLVALARAPWWSLAGAWFFVCLAPTSSVVPVVSQTIAEHRVYLASAAIVAGLIFGAARVLGARRVIWAGAALALACGVVTALRNETYATELSLWGDTVAKRPDNARARVNYALALAASGRRDDALRQLDLALQSEPTSADAHFNRGVLLAALGRRADAQLAYRRTLELRPDYAEAHNNLGHLALAAGDWSEAAAEFRAAIQRRPRYAEAHSNLSIALLEQRQVVAAITAAERAVALEPGLALGFYNLGNALVDAGRIQDAREAFRRSVALDPENAEARNNFANVLVEAGEWRAALEQYDAALQLRPTLLPALRNSAALLAQQGRFTEALGRYERVVTLDPTDAQAQDAVRRLRSGQR